MISLVYDLTIIQNNLAKLEIKIQAKINMD